MSEEQGEYITEEEVSDAMEMLGAGYSVRIEPARKILERRGRETYEIEKAAFVKLSTAFKSELKDIDGNSLKVWLFISLSINRNTGMAFPGLRLIAKETNMAINTVQKSIETLTDLGLLTVYKEKRKTNLYEPTAYVSANKSDPEPVSPDDTDGESVSNSSETVSKLSQSVSPRVIHNQSNQNNHIPQKTKKTKDTLDLFLQPNKKVEEIEEMINHVEKVIGAPGSINYGKKSWEKAIKYLIEVKDKGWDFKVMWLHLNSEELKFKKDIPSIGSLMAKPDEVVRSWMPLAHAVQEETLPDLPHMRKYVPEEGNYVPNPYSTKR